MEHVVSQKETLARGFAVKAGTRYRRCSKCVMDTTVFDITFDDAGVCNYCYDYDRIATMMFRRDEGKTAFKASIEKIKAEGKGKQYDCILGVSGGCDSTTAAYRAKQAGLRPLAVHFDNGWNSELAVANIQKTLDKLEIDLYTYVVDWPEFRDLQLSFFKASVPNVEIPTDHAINALLYKVANERGVNYLVMGGNVETEAVSPSWLCTNMDYRYIRSIQSKFGKKKLKTFPKLSLPHLVYYRLIKQIKRFRILDYETYNKEEAKKTLIRELGWVDYGGKHFESVFTRFFQGYYLPQKFNIDKRLPHYSALINAGQMKREDALTDLKEPPYSLDLMKEDKEYVVKKLGITMSDFDSFLDSPHKCYDDYPNNGWIMGANQSKLKEGFKALMRKVSYAS